MSPRTFGKATLMAFLGAIALAVCSTSQAESYDKSPAFDKALKRHLDAILAKDLEAYQATLTGSDDLFLIFPGGALIDSTEAVVDFHRQWFEDAEWIMEPEIIKTIQGNDQATALLRYQYRDSADAEPRTSWLVLVFRLEDGQWRLVHDQNTRITAQEPG